MGAEYCTNGVSIIDLNFCFLFSSFGTLPKQVYCGLVPVVILTQKIRQHLELHSASIQTEAFYSQASHISQ